MKSPRPRDAENHESDAMPFVVPFPDLPRCVPPSSTRVAANHEQEPKKTTKKRRHRDDPVAPTDHSSSDIKEGNNAARSSTATNATSAPISLPDSHVRRTPSELRLEALTLAAEREDAIMRSRLFGGMRTQIMQREDGVHLLSRKSMEGIINTKLANDRELEQLQQEQKNPTAEDSGWELSYAPIDEEDESSGSSAAEAPLSNDESEGSSSKPMNDEKKKGAQEDDFVFSMEL